MKNTRKLLLTITALILVTLACQAGAVPQITPLPIATPIVQVEQPVVETTTSNEPIFLPPDSLTALYEQVSPGVVSIKVLTTDAGGQGSGFVIDSDGHILTNYHVVEGATDIEVDFTSGFSEAFSREANHFSIAGTMPSGSTNTIRIMKMP